MKNSKVSAVIFYAAAIVFDVAAIICFGGKHTSPGVILLCFGSMFLCLGTRYSRKSKGNKSGHGDEKKQDE